VQKRYKISFDDAQKQTTEKNADPEFHLHEKEITEIYNWRKL